MKWSEWTSTIWGNRQTICQDVTTAEAMINLSPVSSGWETDVYVLFSAGITAGIRVQREDISNDNLLDVQNEAIAWADGVIEKLGAFLSTEGSDVITGREIAESQK